MKKWLGWTAWAIIVAAIAPSSVMAERALWLQDEAGSIASDPLASSIQLCGCADAACSGSSCGGACSGGCGCNSGCEEGPLSGLLGKILRPSDHCFDGFISPMTNPFFFEDPRTLTEARAIFAHHNIPAAVAGGGSVQLYAMQVRLALTERLSVIATKDGYVVSSNPVIRDGWADISAGLKYNLIRDVARQRLLSVGATYELPTGSPRTFQGNGDGEFNLFYSGARRIGENFNWLSGGGIRIPADDDAESSSMFMSQHFDVRMTERFYLLTEVNWFHWYDSGSNALLNTIEGHDLFNFGSTNVDGNDLVTMAFGGKFKPCAHSELGIAYEVPVTGRQDITTNRLTVDMILRY